jgi:hypothetical protein
LSGYFWASAGTAPNITSAATQAAILNIDFIAASLRTSIVSRRHAAARTRFHHRRCQRGSKPAVECRAVAPAAAPTALDAGFDFRSGGGLAANFEEIAWTQTRRRIAACWTAAIG